MRMIKQCYPQPGDAVLVFGKSLTAEAIDGVEDFGMWIRKQHRILGTPTYFHSAIYVGDGQIIEALGRGLTLSPVSRYAGSADIWGLDLTAQERREVVDAANWMYAEKYTYDYPDLAKQFLRLVFRLQLPWKLKHSIVCSVYDFYCFDAIGRRVAKHMNCAPQDLATYGELQWRGRFSGKAAHLLD